MYRLCMVGVLLVLCGCGRYFAGPLRPADQQQLQMTINDDGSVTYALERLEIILQPVTDAQLNRQFAAVSQEGAESTNPYTFGNWTPPGEDWTPRRFTVFRLRVSNYQFPKVMLDPERMEISTSSGREYEAMTYAQLDEYYRAYWLGRTGAGRERFEARTDLLNRTLYPAEPVFSGQDAEGYVVFPVLDDDVTDIAVRIPDIAVRFNYADEPVETLDLTFNFEREVFRGYEPPPQLATQY